VKTTRVKRIQQHGLMNYAKEANLPSY